jgi:N utilization substance protein B
MISRRLLRIKVLQVLYAYYKSDQKDLNISEKELHFSINKAFELYYYFLLLIVDIVQYAESRIDLAMNKRMPSFEDLNPNRRFVENKFVSQLINNKKFNTFLATHKISWVNYPELIKELYNQVLEMPEYSQIMAAKDYDYQEDKKLISKIYTDIILNNEYLSQLLEDQSIYWNDDVDFVISMVVKTIKKFQENDENKDSLLDLYKNEEDKDFIVKLFRKSVTYRKISMELIEANASNWDLDRIAFMDVLIMQLAITELIEFKSIPTKVTLNEFLEIAKYYSTEKSNSFINGVLDKIMQKLKEEKKIVKTGRGLIGEV